jgi:hypothetical protein
MIWALSTMDLITVCLKAVVLANVFQKIVLTIGVI